MSGEAATRSGDELRSVAGAGRDGGPGPDDGRSERVQRIVQRMRVIAHAHDLRRAQAATALGMSETRVEALRLVAAAPEPLTMGQLAARLHTDRPYASTVVDDLEVCGVDHVEEPCGHGASVPGDVTVDDVLAPALELLDLPVRRPATT